MAQSFSLANIVPQNAQHNSGAWAKIEKDTRHYVRRAKGDVYVITGPVFTEDSLRIGNNGVMVPTYLFKLVYDQSTNRAWAHWQQNQEGERVSRPISYEELVKRTGVESLPGLGCRVLGANWRQAFASGMQVSRLEPGRQQARPARCGSSRWGELRVGDLPYGRHAVG